MNENVTMIDLTIARQGEEIVIYCRQIGTTDLVGLDTIQIGNHIVNLINEVPSFTLPYYKLKKSENEASENEKTS